MTAPLIRPLGAADAEAYQALRLEGVKLFPTAFLVTAAEAAATERATIAARLETGQMLGAFEGARLTGFAGHERRPNQVTRHRASVGPLYVTPAAQGSGTAAALMDRIEVWAREVGVEQLELWVAEENARARAFYRRLGYVEWGRMPNAVKIDGTGRADLFLIKMLGG